MYYRVEKAIIAPHLRRDYQYNPDQPKKLLIGHSRKWPRILKEIEESRNKKIKIINEHHTSTDDEVVLKYGKETIKYVYSAEGALGLHTQIVKNVMQGSREIINIGCVGSLDSNIKPGTHVICRQSIRHSGFGNQIASKCEIPKTSDHLSTLMSEISDKLSLLFVQANVWCVQSLYYTKGQIKSAINSPLKPKVVEMEMDSGCLTTNWLNANYFTDQPIHYAHLGYVSDIVKMDQSWNDPFEVQSTERLIPWKKSSFYIAAETFENLQTS